MNPRRTLAVSYRYFLLIKGNGTRLFQLLVWGALDILIWGFLTKYLDGIGATAFSFTSLLLGAAVTYEFMTRAQQGVSSPFLEDIWARNLLNFFGSPLKMGEYITGLVSASIVTSTVSFSVIVVFAAFAFGFPLWSFGPVMLAFLLVMFIFGISLGILAISILLRFGPSAEWFVWPIPSLLAPFVGVFYPITVLPGWIQIISHVIPVTYVFQDMRSIVIDHSYALRDLFVSAGLDVVFFALAYAVFMYTYTRARRSGAIARYSAESYS